MNTQSIEKRMEAIAKRHKALQTRKNASSIWNEFINVINLFQSGKLALASSKFYDLFCSNIKGMRVNKIPQDTCLYRMRAGTTAYDEFITEYEMSHIPFELNHLVSNERYSISGFPSLYLGTSAYVCWEELHRPNFEYTNTPLFKTKKDVYVLDLTNQKYYSFTNHLFSDCLILACSIPVAYPDAPFKPEYIIPQMLLQSLVQYINTSDENVIFGIKYSSTHIKKKNIWINYPENRHYKERFYNYVFPAFDRESSGISKHISDLFQFWNSITYQKLALMHPNFKSNGKDQYYETKFGLIEEYLKSMPPSDMLTYDASCPCGQLT